MNTDSVHIKLNQIEKELIRLGFWKKEPPKWIDDFTEMDAVNEIDFMEWLQFILWVMAVTVKLALYLYALVRLLGGQNKAEDSAAGLDRFPLYPGGVWLLCAVLRKLDLDAALSLRNVLTWSFVGLTWIGGAAACLYRRLRRC